jgi:hypothetical protein
LRDKTTVDYLDSFVNNNFNQVMARQKEFDRDDALRSAMQVFS